MPNRLETKRPTDVHALLLQGVNENRLIQFRYREKLRVAEPHDYGKHSGKVRLFCYQVGGQSSESLPNWRWIEVEGISDLELLQETFRGNRPSRANTTFGMKYSRGQKKRRPSAADVRVRSFPRRHNDGALSAVIEPTVCLRE